MRDVVAEILVGLALMAVGVLVVYLFRGGPARGIDLDLAYIIGAVVISVPAIAYLEWKRRRKF